MLINTRRALIYITHVKKADDLVIYVQRKSGLLAKDGESAIFARMRAECRDMRRVYDCVRVIYDVARQWHDSD